MKRNEMLLIRLTKEIEAELGGIKRLVDEYSELPGGDALYFLRAKASIFHDFYTAVERIMQKIAEELNGGVPRSEQWHKELLFDMTLDLEGVRPPVFSKDVFDDLNNFLRFRHLFRNNYGYDLKAERIKELENAFPAAAGKTLSAIENFCGWMLRQTER